MTALRLDGEIQPGGASARGGQTLLKFFLLLTISENQLLGAKQGEGKEEAGVGLVMWRRQRGRWCES